MIDPRSFMRWTEVPPFDRGNAYVTGRIFDRVNARGVIESFANCPEGQVNDPTPNPTSFDPGVPPCFVAPPSKYLNQSFPRLEKGNAPLIPPQIDPPRN